MAGDGVAPGGVADVTGGDGADGYPSLERRALCIWLGGLASHREGLVGRLVKRYGTIREILARSPDELAGAVGALCRRKDGTAAASDNSDPGNRQRGTVSAATFQDASDEAAGAFRSILRQSPAAYLRSLQGHGPGHDIVAWCDALYPPALRHLVDPPFCLFVRHDCPPDALRERLEALTARPIVAVVGARTPSVYGEEMAALLGRDLTRRGVLVVSGLAMGIDALAQRAAVDAAREAQHPATVAVLGCGADVVYPKVNAALQADITTRGLILSEFAWGVPARAWRFPARNRVIAALAQAVVIVEGTNRSGARITADFALDLGREVLAVPGEAGKRLSAAPHSLLRQGACLCESADDVLAAIAPLGSDAAEVADYSLGRDAPTFPGSDRHAAATILRMLAAGPLSADDIALRCMIPAGAVSAALSELEVDGYVRVVAGGAYRLRAR